MSYIVGIALPKDKNLVSCLCSIYGVGLNIAKKFCCEAGFTLETRLGELEPYQIVDLENIIENSSEIINQDLRKVRQDKIFHLINIQSYRGLRHRKGLPVRGQRTHTNAKRRLPVRTV